jgi:amino acid adenylation domain-containing protein
LTIALASEGTDAAGHFEYRTDLFEHETILRLTQHLENLLRSAWENPATQISRLEILGEQERRQILFDWNATDQPCPRGCVHELFEKQAATRPDAVALIDGDRRITYNELNQRANQLAHHLLERGVGPEVLVGFCMEQSWMAVVGIMGILKAGGAYIPLDPNYPSQRLDEMMQDAKLSLVVSSTRCRDRVPGGVEIVSVDQIPDGSIANPIARTSPDSAAYVLYTSGSTGKPKAVVGIHRSIINGLNSVAYAPDEICCLNALLSYGFSIANLFLPLMCGLPLVIVSVEELKDIHGLLNIIERERISRIVLLPPVLKQILNLGPKHVSKLRTIRAVGLAGAVLTPDIIALLTDAMPLAKIHNCYSSSEIGTLATVWNVTAAAIRRRETLIGRPVANTRMYILDPAMNPVPVGVAGEIYMGAPHLARGYLNRPELTAERFLPDPFSAVPGARLYRSGDLGRYLPSGDIEYLGRADDQVKIRGFRVELAEIEAALCSHPAVAQAVAVPRDSQNTSLIGYIVCKDERSVSNLELRRFLSERLPDFMIPASFTPIARMPLLASGKVDRIALPKPSGRGLQDARTVAPSNDMEAWLLEIWESVLGTSGFGVSDSFFDLGGNSLQAAAVVSQIEDRVNRRVPPAVFLKESTIRQLAEYLCREDRYPSGIVPIQIGSGPALYLIHPQVITRLVSEKLGSQHTVIGVEIPAVELPGLKPMASEIARKIREYQPNPPYRLAGWCSYGNLAYEIAQQLHDAGAPVDLVILFESINFSRTRSFGHWYERVRWHISHLRQKPAAEIAPYIREGLKEARRFAKRLVRFANYRLRSRAVDPNSFQPILPADKAAVISASYDYVPRPYTGEVVLFRPAARMHGLNHDPSLGWGSVVDKLRVIDVPGNHFTMFDSPNVDVVASKLEELLARR